jgi:hypothetical protein
MKMKKQWRIAVMNNLPQAACLIPTWRRPKALIRLFKKAPALNSPDTYVGLDRDGASLYAEWKETYGFNCTVILINNPEHYPSNAHQQLKEEVPLNQYESVIFMDDNTTFSSEALYCLAFAHSLFPTSIMTGTNGLGTMFHKDSIAAGKRYPVEADLQKLTKTKKVLIFSQMNMTFWAMSASMYNQFKFWPNNYAWDIELVTWAIMESGVDRLLGCREAMFSKHKHDFKETQHDPADKLRKLGESITILARRYPELANPTWMTYHVPLNSFIRMKNQKTTK